MTQEIIQQLQKELESQKVGFKGMQAQFESTKQMYNELLSNYQQARAGLLLMQQNERELYDKIKEKDAEIEALKANQMPPKGDDNAAG